MKKLSKTVMSIFMALMSAVTMSCGTVENTNEFTETNTSTQDSYIDDLPRNLNFGGETVTFLYRAEVSSEFYADSENGEVVNDAVYKSMRSVEDRLGVKINVVLRDGHYTASRAEYIDHIKSMVRAGDAEYDWVDMMIGMATVEMSEGIYMNIAENKYIDLDKPYYVQNMADSVGIDGKLYFVTGDASLGYLKSAFCLYFNNRVIDDFKLEDPYTLVDEGKWTFDKLIEMTAAASYDLNGDGNIDLEDKLGLVEHDNNHENAYAAPNLIEFYKKNNDGDWVFSYGSQRDVDVCEKLMKLYNTEGFLKSRVTNANIDQQEKYNQIASKFCAGDILFITSELDDAVLQFRDMEDSYGILPLPKFDEEQTEYRTSSRNTHNSFSMPVICKDPDKAGAVLEALSSSNHETVIPAYFETALKTKYSRDDDSSRMYDLIRESMYLDFGYTYCNATGNAIAKVFRSAFTSGKGVASMLAANKELLETELSNYIETVRSNCN